jgi:hypothetical protein
MSLILSSGVFSGMVKMLVNKYASSNKIIVYTPSFVTVDVLA